MFPNTLTSALHNYLDTEMHRARYGILTSKSDADLGAAEAARLALLKELDAPYPTSGEPLMTAVRDFVHARAVFDRCAELDSGLDEAAERLHATRRTLVRQIRSFNPDRTAAAVPGQKTLLVAIDDDEQAEYAVRGAGEFAQKLGATVVILHVVQPAMQLWNHPLTAERRQSARRRDGVELLACTQQWLPAGLPVQRMLREGLAAAQIVAGAKAADAKLIVLGTPCRGRLAHFLLGSTNEAVTRDADCPVITVSHEGPAGAVAQFRKPPAHVFAAC